MSVRVFVPGDSAACSVGADEVAALIAESAAARGTAVEVIRNGSRGMLWLEPFVEVQTPAGPAMKRVCVDGPLFEARTVFAA